MLHIYRYARFVLGLCLVGGLASGQQQPQRPFVHPLGVVHAASLMPFYFAGMPRGGVFLVKGAWLGPDELIVAQPPYGSELAASRIEIRPIESGEVFNAFLIHAWSFQLAAILPSPVPNGMAELTVVYEGRRSDPVEIEVIEASPGIFAQSQEGGGPGVIQNYVSPTQQPLNSLTRPAKPGQYLILWATGLGPIDAPDNADPPVGNLPADVFVEIGDEFLVRPDYAGRAPGMPGIDQINVRLPDDERLVEGCYVRVVVRAGGRSSGRVTVAIARSGELCEHPWGLAPEKLAALDAGERLPVARIFLFDSAFPTPPGTQPNRDGLVSATGQLYLANAFGVARLIPAGPFLPVAPSGGFCGSVTGLTVGSIIGGAVEPFPRPPPPPNPAWLEADAGGTLELLGPNGRRAELMRSPLPDGSAPLPFPRPYQTEPLADDFYQAGEWTLQAAGGADVASFAATFPIPALPVIEAPEAVSRTEDLEVVWPVEGYEPEDAVRVALTVRLPDEQNPGLSHSEAAVCRAPAQSGRIIIPRRAIEALPAPPAGTAEWSVSIQAERILDVPEFDRAEVSFGAQRTQSVVFE